MYKVDKKSFYEMINGVFNYLYGEGYSSVYHNIDKEHYVRNEMYYKCDVENYCLDIDNEHIIEDKCIIKSEKKYGIGYIEPSEVDNKCFLVDENMTDIKTIISPYVFDYKFLIFIPDLLKIFLNKKDDVLVFSEYDVNIICNYLDSVVDLNDNKTFTRVKSCYK